jgi:hypothetical protein
MKTSDLTIGSVYAQKKPSNSGVYAVQVLDKKFWEMGPAWADGQKKFVVREALKGMRPGDASHYSDYRSVGVPVLRINSPLDRWSESVTPDRRITDSHEDILASAATALGIKQASDAAGEFANRSECFRAQVVVTMGDGSKSTVDVVLTTVRPQIIVGDWHTYVIEAKQVEKAQSAARKMEQAEEVRRNEVNAMVAGRMDALLGEAPRNYWNDSQRRDCQRQGRSDFTISEETLLRLLELAEKGAGR